MSVKDLVEYRIAEMTRGYRTGEYSSPTRSRDELRLNGKPTIELYAERNGELHVLCHEMLTALEYLDCDYDILHKFRERLHNVPQCRHDPT